MRLCEMRRDGSRMGVKRLRVGVGVGRCGRVGFLVLNL